MGKKLIIPGADFSDVAIDINAMLYPVKLAQGAPNVIYGSAGFGLIANNPLSPKRIHAPSITPVFIAKGDSVFFKGLRSLDDTKGLLIDGVQYSTPAITHENAEHSLNGDSATKFFTLNTVKSNEYTWTNTLGDGYFIFCFADGANISTAVDISPNEFNLMCSINLE